MTLDAWLQSYEQEFLVYESLEHFVQSAALSHAKKPLFQARQEIFRAMFADYDKRQLHKEAGDDHEGDSPNHRSKQNRQQWPKDDDKGSRASGSAESDSSGSESGDHSEEDINSSNRTDEDTDDYEENSALRRKKAKSRSSRYTSTLYGPTAAPRTLAFFIAKVPFALKLREDTQRRTLRFKRNQVVLRRIVQSLYRSLGSVFHAWKLLVRQKKEERLNTKGAQLTAMVVQQRGLIRSVFVEWSKATLRERMKEMRSRELEMRQQHELVIADLHKEIFLLRERNRELQLELAENQRYCSVSQKLRSPDSHTFDDPYESLPADIEAGQHESSEQQDVGGGK